LLSFPINVSNLQFFSEDFQDKIVKLFIDFVQSFSI
jgi:hypothetical protein